MSQEQVSEKSAAPAVGDATAQAVPEAAGSELGDAAAGAGRGRRATLRRHRLLITLCVLAAVIGAATAWQYNQGFRTRAANDSAVIRSGADLSSYVTPGDYTEMTVPIRNDSPYAITIIGLKVINAPRILWEGPSVKVQVGATAYLRVRSPSSCPAVPHALKHPKFTVSVAVRALTVDGRMHGSLQAQEHGVLQYAADYCLVTSPNS